MLLIDCNCALEQVHWEAAADFVYVAPQSGTEAQARDTPSAS